MKLHTFVLGIAVVFLAASCSDDGDQAPATGGAAGVGGGSGNAAQDGAGGSFSLTSGAFAEGEVIPQQYECTTGGGTNISPPLAWTAGPPATQSYAVVLRDLDYQSGFLHWVIWDIPASVHALPENVGEGFEPATPAGAKQAPFLTGAVGYYGPCSPNSVNTYEFTVYALPGATLSGLDASSTIQQAATAIESSALASAKLSGES
jgi:Raf kinase inhibitor-like YbhB/YbcL family protein